MSNHFNYRITTNHCEHFALERMNTVENPLDIMLERGITVEEVSKMTKKRKFGVLNLKKESDGNARWIEQKYATKLQIKDKGVALSWDVFRDFYKLDDELACKLEYRCALQPWKYCEKRLVRAGVKSIKLCGFEYTNEPLSEWRAAPIVCVTEPHRENCVLGIRLVDNIAYCELYGVDSRECGDVMIIEFDTAELTQRDVELNAISCYSIARDWATSQSIGHNEMSVKKREWIQQEYPDLWEANESFRKAQHKC